MKIKNKTNTYRVTMSRWRLPSGNRDVPLTAAVQASLLRTKPTAVYTVMN